MKILSKDCIGCGYCFIVCKKAAISRELNMIMKISSEQCTDCIRCQTYCPTGAIVSTEGKK